MLAALLSGVIRAETIDVRSAGEPFKPLWSAGVGAGRANEGLRAAWL